MNESKISPITGKRYTIQELPNGFIIRNEDDSIFDVWDEGEEYARGIVERELSKRDILLTERQANVAMAYLNILYTVEDDGLEIWNSNRHKHYFDFVEFALENALTWAEDIVVRRITENAEKGYRNAIEDYIKGQEDAE